MPVPYHRQSSMRLRWETSKSIRTVSEGMTAFKGSWMITDVILHKTAVEELKKTGLFKAMSNSVDEDEHSIEMHLPYTYKIFER